MSDRNNFDTLDILAAAIGVALAFMMLPFPSDRTTERVVVGISVFLMVVIKRCIFPTKTANPESKASTRMAYLLIALIGTACLALALLGIFAGLEEFSKPAVIEILLSVGIALLVVATFIDRSWLKLRD